MSAGYLPTQVYTAIYKYMYIYTYLHAFTVSLYYNVLAAFKVAMTLSTMNSVITKFTLPYQNMISLSRCAETVGLAKTRGSHVYVRLLT